ncbi:hypothetical protein [Xanthomonas campestris]|uniref:hypothetical protein n=1 Tax=Xanthomonas campestris TaxID=339 RepID=UPI003CE991DF
MTTAPSPTSFATVFGYATAVGTLFAAGYGANTLIGQASGMEYLRRSDFISKDEVKISYVEKSSYDLLKSKEENLEQSLRAIQKAVATESRLRQSNQQSKLLRNSLCDKFRNGIEKLATEKKWIDYHIANADSEPNEVIVYKNNAKQNIVDLRRQSSELHERILEESKYAGECAVLLGNMQ